MDVNPRKAHLGYAVAMLAVGIAAGGFGIIFRGGLGLFFRHVLGEENVLKAFQRMPVVERVLLPAVGAAAAAALGAVVSRGTGGHGVAQILEAVALGRGRIGFRTAIGKAIASFLAIVSGGSVGREGPLLQFGAAVGAPIGERFGLNPSRVRALVAAGTAAGFAAAYNTPIAAVLFVVEIVTGVLTLDVILPVVVATTVATWMSRAALGVRPLYGLRGFSLASGRELGAYAGLGVLTGLVGPLFMWSLAAGARAFRRVPVPVAIRGALGGLIVGGIAVGLPEVAGNGYEAIQLMLDEHYLPAMMAVLLVAKALATTASVSSGSPGGVFTPSLFLGAATGGLAGAIVSGTLSVHGSVGGYVLVGMAGAIAATTHAPVMASVLGFELAGDYGIVLPLFIATILATVVSRHLRPDSIYTEELRRRGIPWERSLEQRIASTVRARDILEMDPFVLRGDQPAQLALDVLARTRTRVVFVTGGPAVGAIDLHRVADLWPFAGAKQLDPAATCASIAVPVPVASPDDSLLALSEKLFEVDWGEIPVVDGRNPDRIIGVVSRRTLLATFDREFLRRDLLHTRVVWTEGQSEAADYLELPRQHRVEVVAAPSVEVGRPLDVCRLRSQDHVILVAVRSAARESPGPEWIDPMTLGSTKEGDRWMVIGTAEAIETLRGAKSWSSTS